MTDIATSDNYRLRDPVKIVEQKQRRAMFRKARAIYKLPEEFWTNEVEREPKDQQEELWVMLKFLRSHPRMRPRP